MKKYIATILLILTIMGLTGCKKAQEFQWDLKSDVINKLGFTIIESFGDPTSYSYFIVYDNETRIMYYLTLTVGGPTLCPYHDEDGEVMIYEGE